MSCCAGGKASNGCSSQELVVNKHCGWSLPWIACGSEGQYAGLMHDAATATGLMVAWKAKPASKRHPACLCVVVETNNLGHRSQRCHQEDAEQQHSGELESSSPVISEGKWQGW